MVTKLNVTSCKVFSANQALNHKYRIASFTTYVHEGSDRPVSIGTTLDWTPNTRPCLYTRQNTLVFGMIYNYDILAVQNIYMCVVKTHTRQPTTVFELVGLHETTIFSLPINFLLTVLIATNNSIRTKSVQLAIERTWLADDTNQKREWHSIACDKTIYNVGE